MAPVFASAAASGYSVNIEKKTLENENYREVLFTGPRIQLVVMKLEPGEEIGMETHEDGDQFIRVETGDGEAILNGKQIELSDGVVVVIPAGVEHNVINTSETEALRLYVIYSPPEHPDGTVQRTKPE
ncbi:MAG TPA: cupin domain-containing protein [Gammaproteobacteria bacterium]|nr:cupin domain-containing protein [Gammaproteobacteria bacterium]